MVEDIKDGDLESLIKISGPVAPSSSGSRLLRYVTAPLRYPLYGMLTPRLQQKLATYHEENPLHYTRAGCGAEASASCAMLAYSGWVQNLPLIGISMGIFMYNCFRGINAIDGYPVDEVSGSVVALPMKLYGRYVKKNADPVVPVSQEITKESDKDGTAL